MSGPLMTMFAPCPPGAEEALVGELTNLGASEIRKASRGVGFRGDLALVYRASLALRTASRILLELASGRASDEDGLYKVARTVTWESSFDSHRTIACRVTGAPRDKDPRFATLRLKDAVVDAFRDATGRRPSVDRRDPDLRIEARWDGRNATIFLNWSGPPLHERGYRLEKGEAVLRETTAAALLIRAGWPAIAQAGGALVDPVCGSGTLLAEGAMIAGNIPPGVGRRKWGFPFWKDHDKRLWDIIRAEAAVQAREGLDRLPRIIGFDKDGRTLESARANLRRASLDRAIRLDRHDITVPRPPRWPAVPRGLVIADPPYGHRMGSGEEIPELYAAIGRSFQTLPKGWSLALLAPDETTAAYAGLPMRERVQTESGGMDIHLCLYGAEAPIPHRTLESTKPSKTIDKQDRPSHDTTPRRDPKVQSLRNALNRNLEALSKWASKSGVTSYRIWDADMPEFNAAVDWYEGRWLHVQEYAAPKSVPVEKAALRLDTLVAVLTETTQTPEDKVFIKTRLRGKRPYEKQDDKGQRFLIRENGLKYWVNLRDYLDTGIFLDHRPTRKLIKDASAGGRFLNLFSYTGTATVAAAAGGAISTTTVDVSHTYLDWAKDNLALNGLNSEKHRFLRSDAMEFLEKTNEAFDLIFLDPPTYSNGKGRQDFSVQDGHPGMIRTAVSRLTSQGILLFSENFRKFALDPKIKRDFQVREITRETMPPDFARRGIAHRCWEIRRR